MAAPLKDIYSPAFYNTFASIMGSVHPGFDASGFISRIFTDDFPEYELKQRMAHTSGVLHRFLSRDFDTAADQIEKLVHHLKHSEHQNQALAYMFLPDYIARFGIGNPARSIAAMEQITQFTSCEFAVRHFLIKYKERMIKQMQRWSQHKNKDVRRLASEGMRPRLPWAKGVAWLKKDPELILPILENLKNDPSEYVRRSVANNLNDISKDHPEVVKQIAGKWLGKQTNTDALVKHGCRTLFKKGDAETLALFGFTPKNIRLTYLKNQTSEVKQGENLEFSFAVKNTGSHPRPVRIEYAIYFLRKNGTHHRKVFKISERTIEAGHQTEIQRRQSFRKITTRRYYPGVHKFSVILNGRESEPIHFKLLEGRRS